MPHPSAYCEKLLTDTQSIGHIPINESIKFYGDLHWNEYKVHVWGGWQGNSASPMLGCFIPIDSLLRNHRPNTVVVDKLTATGWVFNNRDGAHRYLDVDQISKCMLSKPPVHLYSSTSNKLD